MAAEQVLKLFDTYWFETTIFTKKTPSSPFQTKLDSNPHFQVRPLDTKFVRIPTLQVRSLSDQNLLSTIPAFSDSPSPNSVLAPQKLKPILSGKEVENFPLEKVHVNHEEEEVSTKKKLSHSHRKSLRKGKTTKSLSELEFKELKGFMDLGFVFSEEDNNSSLVSLIPGLQRLRRCDDKGMRVEQQKIDENGICRPYLSEAWSVLQQRKVVNPLLNWRVPGNEIDMKDNLRFWAHTVASIA